jgi:hypothetical protein
MVATLPISAGPALVFLAVEHGPAFLQVSAQTGLAVFAATAVFAAVYTRLAQRRGTLISTGGALFAWLIAVSLIRSKDWSAVSGLTLNGLVFGAAIGATYRYRRVGSIMAVPRKAWDVPFRAAIVMTLVATVIIVGRFLGPEAAGIIAVFPMVFVSIAVLLQPRLGGAIPAAIMANGLIGLIGLVTALSFLSVAPMMIGSVAALTVALVICVLWNLGLVGMRRFVRRIRE